jgi:hypothetical protein
MNVGRPVVGMLGALLGVAPLPPPTTGPPEPPEPVMTGGRVSFPPLVDPSPPPQATSNPQALRRKDVR